MEEGKRRFTVNACLDITSLSDFMTPVRRVRHCANHTTIRYIPMQSSNSLATRILELSPLPLFCSFPSSSPSFTLSCTISLSPFSLIDQPRHPRPSLILRNIIFLEFWKDVTFSLFYLYEMYIYSWNIFESKECLFIKLWDKFTLNEIGARTEVWQYNRKRERTFCCVSFQLTQWISFNLINLI